MFTGIIEEIGKIKKVQHGARSSKLVIEGEVIFEELKLGDSVAVNGVCLTVSSLEKNTFSADVMNETLKRSSLGILKNGSNVNLERAMPANGRFGGHIVSGHINGTGKVTSIKKDDNAVLYKILAEEKLLRYIIEKGSITIDGISLTVVEVSNNDFSVSIIPHTNSNTILSETKIGDIVNLENDFIGKYIEKMFISKNTEKEKNNITPEFLAKFGF